MVAALLKYTIAAVGLLLWTWLWFLPVGGFHYMFRCGVLGWAILDGENEVFEVRWSSLLLAVSFVCWLGGLVVVRTVRRYRDRQHASLDVGSPSSGERSR